MNTVENIKTKLVAFRDSNKFELYGHLQPAVENSTEEDKRFINDEINLCVDRLLKGLSKKKVSENELKKIVRSSIEKVQVEISDTEDREFCYELYSLIGDILGIDIEDNEKSLYQQHIENLARIMRKDGVSEKDIQEFMKKVLINTDNLSKE